MEGFKFLQFLNLSFNEFEGEVPNEGIFQNASVVGNKKLCGGISGLQLPKCSKGSQKRKSINRSLMLIICIVSGILGMSLLLSLILFCWFRKRSKMPSSITKEHSILKLTYQSIHKATNGFSPDNLIGAGSFGTVFKGTFDELNGKVVAVKAFNLLGPRVSKEF